MGKLIDKRYSFKAEDDWGCYGLNGQYIKGDFDKAGYCCHRFKCQDGTTPHLREHREKWIYFNGEIPEGYEIDHIIPIKNGGTNKLSNLRLVTRKENINNELSKINNSKAQRNNPKQSKLVYQYTLDGELVKIWPSTMECGRNGFLQSSVSLCCSGKYKTHKGHKWSFQPL